MIGIMIIELNVLPLDPLFNKLTNIIEVIIVAEPDFFLIPIYSGIKLTKEKDRKSVV